MKNDTTSQNIRQTVASQFLISALPIAIIFALLFTPITYFSFPHLVMRHVLTGYLLVLAAMFAVLRYLWLPRVSTTRQHDLAVFLIFGMSEFANQLGNVGTPIACSISSGLLVMLSAFAMLSTPNFLWFVGFVIVGHGISRYMWQIELGRDFVTFVLIVTTYGMLVRYSVAYMQTELSAARKKLCDKVDELVAEKRLREDSEKQFVHAQKMEGLGLLATGVAHDFNNYLHAINGMAELIENERPSKHASQIRAVAKRAADICKKMLAYAGKTHDEMDALDIVDCIRQMEPVLCAGLNKNIRLSLSLPNTSLYAQVNQTSLQQCLTNLVRNAADSIEAENEHGDILIAVSPSSGSDETDSWRQFGEVAPANAINIEVRDSGIGMDSSVLERAFDPYFTTKKSGHGFGLSTTLGIVRSFGGVIRCRTQLGIGTQMSLRLPKLENVQRGKPTAPLRTELPECTRILLVDDEEYVRTTLAELLEAKGWSVECADTGHRAWEILQTQAGQFDVALIDYAMPEMNGHDLLKRMRQNQIELPVILCSGYAKESVFLHSDAVPNAFLKKPFSVNDFTDALSEILNSPR